MRITALYDRDGLILAAAKVDDDYAGPVPVATEEGTEVGTFEVPEVRSDQQLDEICRALRVSAGSLVEG
jgi:hypothetical protein